MGVLDTRQTWRAFRRPHKFPDLMEHVSQRAKGDPEFLRKILRTWRGRSLEQHAILARALAGLGQDSEASIHAENASHRLLEELLLSGGEPGKKRIAACTYTLLLLGDTYRQMGQDSLADRHHAAAVACGQVALEKLGRADLLENAAVHIGSGARRACDSLAFQELFRTLRNAPDSEARKKLEERLRQMFEAVPGEAEREAHLSTLQEALSPSDPGPKEKGRSPGPFLSRVRAWMGKAAWQKPLPRLLGNPESAWVRLRLRRGIRWFLILFAFTFLLFAYSQVVCQHGAEKAIDHLLERAQAGFFPEGLYQRFVPSSVQVLLLGSLCGLLFLAIPWAWWIWRIARLAASSMEFDPALGSLQRKIKKIAGATVLACLLLLALIYPFTNIFRTPVSIVTALAATFPSDTSKQGPALQALEKNFDFRAQNQIDNYFRVLLALHFEARKDYASTLRVWQGINRMAYVPLWEGIDPQISAAMVSRQFFEYESQMANRLVALEDFERRLSQNGNDASLLVEYGTYLLGHGRLVPSLECLSRALATDPQGCGLFEHSRSAAEALTLFRGLAFRRTISSDRSGQDLGKNFLVAASDIGVIHRLGWAIRESLRSPPSWAREALRSRSDAAVAVVLKISAENPDHPRVQINVAEFLGMIGRWPEADLAFERVNRMGGMDATGYASWGCTLYSLRNYARAVRMFEYAAQMSPQESFPGEVFYSWAASLVRVSRKDEAAEKFQRAILQHPDDPFYHNEYGKALNSWGDYEAAILEFQATEGIWPFREALTPWIFALNQLGKSLDAMKLARRAIRYQSQSASLYSETVTDTLRGLPEEHYSKSRDIIIAEVLNLRKEFGASWKPDLLLARTLCRLGDRESAASMLSRLELFVPPWDRLGWVTRPASDYLLWGWVYLDLGSAEAALKKFQTTLRAGQEESQAYQGLGTAYARLGQWEDSERAFEQMVKWGKNRAASYFEWAKVLGHCGKHNRAAELYRKAAEAGADRSQMAMGWISALLQSGQSGKVMDIFSMDSVPPGQVSMARRERTLTLLILDRWTEAGKGIGETLAESPEAAVFHWLGGIQKLGERSFDDAAQRLQKAERGGHKEPDPIQPIYHAIIQAHRSGVGTAQSEMREHLKSIRHSFWPVPLFRFCAGEITAEDTLKLAAQRVDAEELAARLCVSYYLLGEMAAASGDNAAAERHWKLCLAQNRITDIPHALAKHLTSNYGREPLPKKQ